LNVEYNGYNIDTDGAYGMKIIKTIGRGSLPLELRGTFTNTYMAKKAIDISLATKKENKNGEVVLSD
jgi:hypothetical protein